MAKEDMNLEYLDQMNKFMDGKFEELKQAFARFDKKAKGVISLQCLGLLLRNLGFNPTEDEVTDLTNEADIDGSGTLDFIEFLHLMNYFWDKKTKETVRNIFEVYDLNGSGTIGAEELTFMMTEFGFEDFTENDSLEMIGMADIDEDGNIDLDEFALLLDSMKKS